VEVTSLLISVDKGDESVKATNTGVMRIYMFIHWALKAMCCEMAIICDHGTAPLQDAERVSGYACRNSFYSGSRVVLLERYG
jgi:hypothetical protein